MEILEKSQKKKVSAPLVTYSTDNPHMLYAGA